MLFQKIRTIVSEILPINWRGSPTAFLINPVLERPQRSFTAFNLNFNFMKIFKFPSNQAKALFLKFINFPKKKPE